jgi:formylglycine-generating enzyme required for sulfatase activity
VRRDTVLAFMRLARGLFVVSLLAVLGCTPELATSVTPGEGWPDLAHPPVGSPDGRADSALIIAIDDPELGGRPGAFEVASGWWRYLVETRLLRRSRVRLLRNEDATAEAVLGSIEWLEERSGTGSVLWLVYIGSAISPELGGPGALQAADGEQIGIVPIHDALAAGLHESAFMLIDACAETSASGVLAGLTAISAGGMIDPRERERIAQRTYYVQASESYGSELAGVAAGVQARVEADLRREAGTPRNVFMITAGVGSECAATLDGHAWPALAYAGLGGLQGWADLDEDGHVSATEVAVYVQSVVANLELASSPSEISEPRPRLTAAGVDIILADVSERWSGPERRALGRRGRLAPEALSQTASALDEAGRLIELDVEDMVPVPAGRFTRGCTERDDACEDDERPARRMTLDGYAIDRHEVRWSEYRDCITAGACLPLRLDRCWVWNGESFERGDELPAELFGDDHPVMCVNWLEAANFCSAVGKRLPSEAEWERAARGTDTRTYPWGDAAPTCKEVVMHGCSDFTRAVGSRPAGVSPVGAYDMSGNVAEWVGDWWHERAYGYRELQRRNPTGPGEGEVRVVRGGSFYESDSTLRASYRYGVDPLARLSTLGFRCVR